MRAPAIELRLQLVGIIYAVTAMAASLVAGNFYAGRLLNGAGPAVPAGQPVHLIGLCLAAVLLIVAFMMVRKSLLAVRDMRGFVVQLRSIHDAEA